MRRVQQKGMQEQQEGSALSPVLTHPHPPITGRSSPNVISLQNASLGKRKTRDVEPMDSLPPCKRPHTSNTRSKPSVQPHDKNGQTGPAEPRPTDQPSFIRASAQSVQTVARDLPPLCSPSKCSTPLPLPPLPPLPLPTSPPVVALLPPAIIRESPKKHKYNSTNTRSGLPLPLSARSLRRWTRNRAEFVNIDLRLEFEQEEQEVRGEMKSTVSGSRRNDNQSANGDEDSDKTEPDTDTDRDGSETSNDSQSDDSQVGMNTQDYAMPWRRCMPAIPSPPSDERFTGPILRGNKGQVLVPASQSTGNPNSQASAEQLPLGLHRQPEVGPSPTVDRGARSVESIGPSTRKELEMDPDTSEVPDSQDDISLLGPSSHLNCNPSSTLPSGIPGSTLPQPDSHPNLEDQPDSQPSQITDPDFAPENASFDEYTDPLEYTIELGSQPEISLELKDEVDRLESVVHCEDTSYALRDRERMRRSESGASTGTDAATLVGDYFEAKKEEIKKEMEGPQQSQLTWTDESQCQPSQPLSSESQGSQPTVAPLSIQPGRPKSTSIKLQHLRSRAKALSSVHEERRKRLVIAVLDLIAHWLQVKDVTLIHDVWDGLPPHERTFDRVLRVCLQCEVSAVQKARRHPSRRRRYIESSGEEEDVGGEGGKSTGVTGLRQRYMIAPDPKRRFPYPKGVDPGPEWTKVICRMLGAMYGFKAHRVHQLWMEAGGDVCEVETQLEGRNTGWLDLRGLGLGNVPRPWT